MGDPGLSDDAITGPHHQIQSVEKIAILYWPLDLVSDNTGAADSSLGGRNVKCVRSGRAQKNVELIKM